MKIKRLGIYRANLNPPKGTEVGKNRRVIVIQTDLLNKAEHPSTLICPISTSPLLEEDNYLRVQLKPSKLNGLKEPSDILIDQIRAIDNKRFEEKEIGILDKQYYKELMEKLTIILDLPRN